MELAKLPRHERLGAYENDEFDYTVPDGNDFEGIPSALEMGR